MNNAFKKRIDELGRIVIPKQIREEFNINSYDELNIFIKDDGIFIKKNIGLLSCKEKINNFISFICDNISYDIIIYDDNKVLVSSLDDYSNYINKNFEYNSVIHYMNKYIYKNSIIIDSNHLGDILFISDVNFDKEYEIIKQIKGILFDLIK